MKKLNPRFNKTHQAKPPQLQLLEVTPKGHARKTNKYINLPDAHIHQVVSWGSAVLGPAEFTYPHPKGWVIHLRDKSYDLTQLTVKVLTASFRSHLEVTPTCISSWNSRLPRRIPWDSLGPLIHSQLTTTKDVHSWFKCILHRAMAVRKIFPREGNTHCRLCDCAVENIVHFTECTQLRSTFAPFTELLTNFGIAGPFDAATLLMGCVHASDNESYTTIPKSLFSLLLVLWKFIILMLTQVDTCNFKYSQEQVWRLTLTRFAERCNALHYSHHNKIRQAINRDSPPPNSSKLTATLAPIARVEKDGKFTYSPHFTKLADHYLGDKLELDDEASPLQVSDPQPDPNPGFIQFVKASR